MGAKLNVNVPEIQLARAHVLKDEFYDYQNGRVWTSLTTGGGSSVALTTTVGGTVLLTTGGTQNNEAATATTTAWFKPATNKPLSFRCYFQYAEADTNNAAIAIGLSSLMNTTLTLANTTGTPVTTSSTAAFFYKVPGSTVWKANTQVGTAQTQQTSNTTAGGTAQHYYDINFIPESDGTWEVEYRVDDKPLLDSTTFREIKHSVTLTGVVAMQAGVFVKNAGSATSQTATLDYIGVAQLR